MSETWLTYDDPGDWDAQAPGQLVTIDERGERTEQDVRIPFSVLESDDVQQAEQTPGEIFLSELDSETYHAVRDSLIHVGTTGDAEADR